MDINWPGENLLSKMWESLIDKGVGNLLKPWQIRREAQADTEAKRNEMLILAQAERDAEALRNGAAALQLTGRGMEVKRLTYAPAAQAADEPRLDHLLKDDRPRYEAAVSAEQADTLRREVNVAKQSFMPKTP